MELHIALCHSGQTKTNVTVYITIFAQKEDTAKDDTESVDGVFGFIKAIGLHLRDFLRDVWEVFITKMWICCFIGDLISGFGWGGMFTFLPKTLELQVEKRMK